MWRCNDELRVRADQLQSSSKRDAKKFIEFWKQIPPSEPYHVILGDVRDKLYNTRECARRCSGRPWLPFVLRFDPPESAISEAGGDSHKEIVGEAPACSTYQQI
ncbi:hypothetical protein K1719_020080 [Acacia pycnantha]|nr:hypothetical protein K1719_020080 [Acacia pycnantha]